MTATILPDAATVVEMFVNCPTLEERTFQDAARLTEVTAYMKRGLAVHTMLYDGYPTDGGDLIATYQEERGFCIWRLSSWLGDMVRLRLEAGGLTYRVEPIGYGVEPIGEEA